MCSYKTISGILHHSEDDPYDNFPVDYYSSPHISGKISPRLIVIHEIAVGESLDDAVAWFSNPMSKASTHFIVGLTGKVVQIVRTNIKAWHCGKSSYYGHRNVNNFSIGVSLMRPTGASSNMTTATSKWHGSPDEYRYYPEQQTEEVMTLCSALLNEYPITDIVGHYHVSKGLKHDPNPLFDFRELNQRLVFKRGPSGLKDARNVPEPILDMEAATNETDEVYNSDAVVVYGAYVYAQPKYSAPKIGRLVVGRGINLIEPSRSNSKGRWFLVEVDKPAIKSNDGADSDGKYRGYVNSDCFRLLP